MHKYSNVFDLFSGIQLPTWYDAFVAMLPLTEDEVMSAPSEVLAIDRSIAKLENTLMRQSQAMDATRGQLNMLKEYRERLINGSEKKK